MDKATVMVYAPDVRVAEDGTVRVKVAAESPFKLKMAAPGVVPLLSNTTPPVEPRTLAALMLTVPADAESAVKLPKFKSWLFVRVMGLTTVAVAEAVAEAVFDAAEAWKPTPTSANARHAAEAMRDLA